LIYNLLIYNLLIYNKETRVAMSDPDNDPLDTEEKDPEELVRFGISMPASLVRELDAWRKQRGYGSRSEAVRDLVRDTLVAREWESCDPDAEMVGVVTLVYRHTTRELSEHLTQMQHHHHGVAQAALHVHLNSDNCLEAIVLRGKHADVVHLAQHLISARGVLHGKFIPTTTGEEAP
jgi:CopG family nickel-responsive transcriptional regulator